MVFFINGNGKALKFVCQEFPSHFLMLLLSKAIPDPQKLLFEIPKGTIFVEN